MADLSLPARLLTGVEQLVWSTYMVAREFPFTILPLILIAFASLALLAVSLVPTCPSCLTLPALRLAPTSGTLGASLTRALPKSDNWRCLPRQPGNKGWNSRSKVD